MRLVLLVTLFALIVTASFSSVASANSAEEIIGYGPISQDAGWLVTATELYVTSDAGLSWQNATPAIQPGETALAADFLPSGEGWILVGGPSRGGPRVLRLARTSGWDASWRSYALSLYAEVESPPPLASMELDFRGPLDGVLRARHLSSSNFERWSEWQTADGGATWQRVADPVVNRDEDGRSGADLIDARTGWRLDRTGSCSRSGAQRVCRQKSALMATTDGGQTWRELSLPFGVGGEREWTTTAAPAAAAAAGGSHTQVLSGQGFDKCEIATPEQFWTWLWSSPYSAVSLYIGGSMRYCSNAGLNADYLRYLGSMGWAFIPTWVGPQSSCYGGANPISTDTATAQSQGWSEANAAADRVAALGLTAPDGTGSIIYYDMEAYAATPVCDRAVQSFISGWVRGLHARGNLAGVYGLGPTLSLLANLNPPPDAIWAAHWIDVEYNPDADVWDVYRLSNDLWLDRQRLRQYTGGHEETWGGTTLEIDSNALDGIVAVANPPPPSTPTPPPTPTRVPFTPRAWQYLPLIIR